MKRLLAVAFAALFLFAGHIRSSEGDFCQSVEDRLHFLVGISGLDKWEKARLNDAINDNEFGSPEVSNYLAALVPHDFVQEWDEYVPDKVFKWPKTKERTLVEVGFFTAYNTALFIPAISVAPLWILLLPVVVTIDFFAADQNWLCLIVNWELFPFIRIAEWNKHKTFLKKFRGGLVSQAYCFFHQSITVPESLATVHLKYGAQTAKQLEVAVRRGKLVKDLVHSLAVD